MKSRIVILALVGLTAGVAGTVGSKILAGTEAPAAVVQPAAQESPKVTRAKSTDEECRVLARKVSKTSMSDAKLKQLLKKHKECRTVVVDSKAPGTAASSAPNVVIIPATGSAPASAPSAVANDDEFDDDEYDDDEHEGDDDEHEGDDDEHEDEGEDD